eukprot:250645_1
MKGEVRFIGSVSGKPGVYYGIKLTEPTGKNNGCISNTRYFQCPADYGLFVSRAKIKKSKDAINERFKNLPRVEIGDKVLIRKQKLLGYIRFIGATNFKSTDILYGVELLEPKGQHDGIVDQRQYFECKSQCGDFLSGPEIIPYKSKTKNKKKSSKKHHKLRPRTHSKNKSQTVRILKISPNTPELKMNHHRYPSPIIMNTTKRYQTETNRGRSLLLVHGYCHMIETDKSLVTFFSVYSPTTAIAKRRNSRHNHHNGKRAIPRHVIELCHGFLYDKISVDDFQRMKLLGKGGFAEVRLVRYKKGEDDEELYAMKSLSKKLMLKKKQEKQIFIERDILIHLNNWLIIKLFWSFQDTKYLHLVEEYCEGGDLMSVLQDMDVLCEDETCFYIAEIAQAIHFLHEHKYVHRDIKPDNILLHRSGHIKLCDFGSAGFYDPEYFDNEVVPRRSRKNTKLLYRIVGTPDYVAPEILSKKGYGFECDWWSMGVIMFECLAGYPPFYAGSAKQTCRNILNYTKTLHVPTDMDLSRNAEDCLLKLLCSWQRRMTFHQLKRHPFFKSIKWGDELQEMRPPHTALLMAVTDALPPIDDIGMCTQLRYTRSGGSIIGSGRATPLRQRSRSIHQRAHFKGFTFEGDENLIFGDTDAKRAQ